MVRMAELPEVPNSMSTHFNQIGKSLSFTALLCLLFAEPCPGPLPRKMPVCACLIVQLPCATLETGLVHNPPSLETN